jgi:hypothetical protein
LSADATVPTENAAGSAAAVPFAIEAPWPLSRLDSSPEVNVFGSADGSTSQPCDPAVDSSVVEFLHLLDDPSREVFGSRGQRSRAGSSRGKLAAQSSEFLRGLVKGLAGKAKSKKKKRATAKTGRTVKAQAKSKTRHASAAPKSRARKKGSRPHPERD